MVTRALVGMAGLAATAAACLLAAAATGSDIAANEPTPEARPSLATPAAPGSPEAPVQEANIPYDGRFTFVRIRTDVSGGRGMPRSFLPGGRRGWGQPPWAHDYPRAERNLARILTATTLLNTYEGGSNILTFDDPELHSYPLAYVSEPGFWQMDEAEKEGLRSYLLKGGFVIFDDFGGPRDWANFEAQMMRVLPEGVFYDLPDLDPLPTVFDSFFEISDPEALAPPYRGGWPEYHGIFEDNDPAKRLMVVANYNNDLGDYWEFSDSGWLPIDLTNEAYKFGVNYIIYAMTH
ncbi:MAG: DUF4159 domain-containing protein [Gammaproteobacteria bacterium]|nr:DUF4159 domain-containing protein [Gammaproteobacteria bacterium]MDE0259760.1 DUF4159 domain-containing protein [Gammaproteobacteria bacterium]